jgi:hypothetical protein
VTGGMATNYLSYLYLQKDIIKLVTMINFLSPLDSSNDFSPSSSHLVNRT